LTYTKLPSDVEQIAVSGKISWSSNVIFIEWSVKERGERLRNTFTHKITKA